MSSESDTGLQFLGRHAEAGAVQIGEPLPVDVFLDAGDALIVDIGEAEHMRADRSVGIDALVFGDQADARQSEMEDFVALMRRHLALHPNEALLRAEPLAQIAGVEAAAEPRSEARSLRPCR